MEFRLFKQLKVLLIMLAIFVALLVGVYFVFIYTPPSCFDGIKNQDEDRVDCGGSCLTPCEIDTPEAPIVMWSGFFKQDEDNYSLAAKLRNRNNSYGSPKFDYVFEAKDEQGTTLKEIPGTSFVSPGQTRYIINTNVSLPQGVKTVEFKVVEGKTIWKRTPIRLNPVDFTVYAKNFTVLNNFQFYAEASGVIRNETSYDFRRVEVGVFLYNSRSEVIAVAQTVLEDLVSGKDREFKVFWPKRFEGTYSMMDVIPQTNFFENQNYLLSL
jgi:hypothetical protein